MKKIVIIIVLLVVVFLSQQPYFSKAGKVLYSEVKAQSKVYLTKVTSWFENKVYTKVSREVEEKSAIIQQEVTKQKDNVMQNVWKKTKNYFANIFSKVSGTKVQ